MKSVRDYIVDIRDEAKTDLDPNRAAELLVRISSLSGSVNEKWVEVEMKYNYVLHEKANKYEKVSEAKIKARISEEYRNKLEVEALQETIKELMNSMKYLIKVKMEEMRNVQ